MAIKVGVGVGTDPSLQKAVQEAVRQARGALGSDKISAAVVFATAEFANSATLYLLRSLLGAVQILGASSLAVMTNQGLFKHGLALMLISLPENAFCHTAFVENINARGGIEAGEELGEKLLHGFQNIPRDLSVIFSDGLMRDGSGFLYGLRERMGWSFPLAGASASDNFEFKKTYVYYNDRAESDAACGMLWGGKLTYGLGIKHGWKALGQPRTVTKSQGNTVYEINQLPAVQIYKDYFGFDALTLTRELKRISVLYPIGVYLPGEEECLLRNIIAIEDSGAMVCQGHVPEGSKIRLMIGTKESCLAATNQAVNEVKARFATKHLDLVLVFDSVSRYRLLGRQAVQELEIIKKGLGLDTPVLGMYSYGEQAPLKAINYQGRVYFHNQTVSILGIGG
jgi:hypothetical protein